LAVSHRTDSGTKNSTPKPTTAGTTPSAATPRHPAVKRTAIEY
jgi:hypothetical protein